MRALILVLLLAGCVSLENTDAVMVSWIGKPEADLYASWGGPTRSFETQSGGRIIVYEEVRGTDGILKCDLSFTLNSNGLIEAYAYDGNACAMGG